MRVVQCAYEFPLPDKVGLPETDYYCTCNFCSKAKLSRQRSRSLTRGGDLRRIGIGEQKAKYSSRPSPLAVHPWLPVHSLPYASKLNPICADGLLRLLRTAIAMPSNWFPRAFQKWMHWWGDCR